MLLDGKSSHSYQASPNSTHPHPHHPNPTQIQEIQRPSGLPTFSPSSGSISDKNPNVISLHPSPSSSDHQNMSLNAHASSSKLPTSSMIASISQLGPIPPFQGGKSSQNHQHHHQQQQAGLEGQNGGNSHPSSSSTNPNQNGSTNAINHHQQRTNTSSSSSNHLSMPTTAADLMREGPRDFTVIKEVGDGSFGTVCLADWKSPLPSGTVLSPMQHPTTRPEYVGKRLVAIKKMKKPFPSWGECMKLKELKSLLAIPHHPNIIPLYDAFLEPTSRELHFVFECMEGNLYQLTKSRKGRPLAGGLVGSIFVQIIKGLHHIHEHGYFHRDMKPENLLITTTGVTEYPAAGPYILPGTPPERDVLVIVKLADFGLARETNSKPPYTEYVSTRWYRAPEVLLRSRDYSNPVDMWALGTILAELVNLKPLFPGQSEVDQVLQICEILGDPIREYGRDERQRIRGGGQWERGVRMAKAVGFAFPKAPPVQFTSLFRPRVPPSLIDCIQDLLRYDPRARLTTQQCMEHPYFTEDAPRMQPIASRPPPPPQQQQKPSQAPNQLNRWPGPLQPIPSADRMAVDAIPAQRAIPPSHSNQPSSNKQPFGVNGPPDFRQLPPLRVLQGQNGQPLHRVPFYPQAGDSPSSSNNQSRSVTEDPGSPMREDGTPEVQWAPRPGMQNRDSSVSQYPAFPDSASLYAGSHASFAPSQASTQYDERLQNGSSHRDGASEAQSSNATTIREASQAKRSEQARHTVYDDELSRQHPQLQAPNAGSSSELSDHNDSTGSAETINSKEKRRSRAWGLNISSVFSGPGSGTPLLQRAGGGGGEDSHARQAESMEEKRKDPPQQQSAPLDPKKAKKEAEKQAREQRAAQDKAKRAAQEKAARDRARAVMHKRNQLLASTHGKDQVEWLAVGTGLEELNQPSEKSRGKQPMNGLSSSQTFNSTSSGVASPDYSAGRPSQSTHSIGSGGFGSGNGSQSSASAAWIARGPGQGRLAQSQSKRQIDDDPYSPTYGLESPELGRLRMESSNDGRRISIQSYATGDSDPGPAPNMPRHPAALQRTTSSSSLSSAPSMVDSAGRFAAPSLSDSRNSQDTRSISSLDHQLITNMENMTAAGTPGASVRTPGNVSPGHGHYFGSRPSVSRQSRGTSRQSSSHNRQGSSSPLHHASGVPRFHPYSHGSAKPGSSQSHQSFTLPPLHGLNEGGGPSRTSSRRNRGLSQGSVGSDSPYPLSSPAMHYQSIQGGGEGGVNPMFQVSEQDQEMTTTTTTPASPLEYTQDALMMQRHASAGGTVLPPFSHIAAVASSEEDGRQRQPHSASPTSNVFYSNHA